MDVKFCKKLVGSLPGSVTELLVLKLYYRIYARYPIMKFVPRVQSG